MAKWRMTAFCTSWMAFCVSEKDASEKEQMLLRKKFVADTSS